MGCGSRGGPSGSSWKLHLTHLLLLLPTSLPRGINRQTRFAPNLVLARTSSPEPRANQSTPTSSPEPVRPNQFHRPNQLGPNRRLPLSDSSH